MFGIIAIEGMTSVDRLQKNCRVPRVILFCGGLWLLVGCIKIKDQLGNLYWFSLDKYYGFDLELVEEMLAKMKRGTTYSRF